MPLDDLEHDDIQSTRTRPKTRGLKRALHHQKIEDEKITFEERIAKEIEDDREIWLDRYNIHLEKLLHKENKDNKILRNMSNKYIKTNKVCSIKLKQLQEKHNQNLAKQKEGDKFEIIYEAYLISENKSSGFHKTILNNLSRVLYFLVFVQTLTAFTQFDCHVHITLGSAHLLEASK